MADHCSGIWRNSAFWCLETQIDWFSVLPNDDTTSRIISASEKQVVGGGSHGRFDRLCAETHLCSYSLTLSSPGSRD